MTPLVIETPRLRLRPLAADDIDLALELFTDPDVSRFVAETMTPHAVGASMTDWLRRCADGAIGVWCITDRETGEKLGTGGVLPLPVDAPDTEYDLVEGPDIPDREIEVGYILKPSAWGRGIATETCRALLRHSFESTDLDALVATTHPDHHRSQNVLRKCGFRETGPRRAYAEDGLPGFRITREQWASAAR